MALFKRFLIMVLASSKGGQTAAISAIVASGFEEVLLRAFMPQIDRALNKLLGKPPIAGGAAELQRLGWIAEINIAMICELNAIVVSSIAVVILENHKNILDLGYSYAGDGHADGAGDISTTSAGLVMMQLLMELGTEIFVDFFAMITELLHGIDITSFFDYVSNAHYFAPVECFMRRALCVDL